MFETFDATCRRLAITPSDAARNIAPLAEILLGIGGDRGGGEQRERARPIGAGCTVDAFEKLQVEVVPEVGEHPGVVRRQVLDPIVVLRHVHERLNLSREPLAITLEDGAARENLLFRTSFARVVGFELVIEREEERVVPIRVFESRDRSLGQLRRIRIAIEEVGEHARASEERRQALVERHVASPPNRVVQQLVNDRLDEGEVTPSQHGGLNGVGEKVQRAVGINVVGVNVEAVAAQSVRLTLG